jgi:putative ABC transport system ATP-binding protein
VSGAAFELKNVGKEFKFGDQNLSVLRQINLHIGLGEYVAIMGPSGSGKSTLMHILGCLDSPTSGDLSVCGQNTKGLSDDDLSSLRCRALGFVFQAFHLLPSYNAISNVTMSLAYSGHPSGTDHAVELLKKLGLGHRLNHHPRTLSGGEKQRVAIARALSMQPSILLTDEPTGNLPTKQSNEIIDLFEELNNKGNTILIITHNDDIAKRAKRIITLVDGKIVKDVRSTR